MPYRHSDDTTLCALMVVQRENRNLRLALVAVLALLYAASPWAQHVVGLALLL